MIFFISCCPPVFAVFRSRTGHKSSKEDARHPNYPVEGVCVTFKRTDSEGVCVHFWVYWLLDTNHRKVLNKASRRKKMHVDICKCEKYSEFQANNMCIKIARQCSIIKSTNPINPDSPRAIEADSNMPRQTPTHRSLQVRVKYVCVCSSCSCFSLLTHIICVEREYKSIIVCGYSLQFSTVANIRALLYRIIHIYLKLVE